MPAAHRMLKSAQSTILCPRNDDEYQSLLRPQFRAIFVIAAACIIGQAP